MGTHLGHPTNNPAEEPQLTSLILQDVRRKYRSFSNPNLRFVGKARERRPYRELVEFLMWSGFAVREWTDSEHDVSFTYTLTSDRGMWGLVLSMIGPYANLAR
jgi:hypothetical protein